MTARNIVTTVLSLALLSLAATAAAATMGASRGHDLDALWEQARDEFDISSHDAVLLLESRHETVLENGARRTVVHRVVWIGTPPGLRDHADLRIPWNSGSAAFKVHLLRTWRDGRWWPHESQVSPTAVVETLPYAVAAADDYTAMREVMLLHDGVELPCIMETAYEIEKRPGAAGHDGFFVMQRRDPAVLVELKVTVPEGAGLKIRGYNGAPVPEGAGGTGGEGGSEHIVTMEKVERLGSPRVADPAVYAPCVAWSTWSGWPAVRDAVMAGFDDAAAAGETLAGIVKERVRHEPSDGARVRKIVAMVDEFTRSIHYDSRFWRFSPRPADRTFETAYGHALDRAALAAAMFGAAGLKAEPVYVSSGASGVDAEVPGLSRFGEMRVCVHSDRFRAIYDPYEGVLSEGPRAVFGRMAWKPATDEAPWSYPNPDAGPSEYAVTLTLEPGEDGWKGTGYLDAGGVFCPYPDMAGLDGEAAEAAGAIAGSVLPGAEVTGFSPEVFEKTHVAAGFAFTKKMPDADAHGRRGCTIGHLRGGIAEVLPGDVRLYHEKRTSPVVIPGAMTETVTVRIRACKKSVAHIPEPRSLTNETGAFTISVEMDDGWVTIVRSLSLEGGKVEPEAWPRLRALLLEAEDRAGRTVLMK